MVRTGILLAAPVAAVLGVRPRQGYNVSTSTLLATSKESLFESPIIKSTLQHSKDSFHAQTTTSLSFANVITTAGMSNATNTCCYIYPRGVGVNTWYSSTVDVTVATVITTWLKYNNTIVPGNSTTKTVVDTTSIYGLYEVPQHTLIPVSATSTATKTTCSGWATEGSETCTDWRTTTSTYSAYSTSYSYFNPLGNVSTNLLPQQAWAYGETSIDPTGAVTFPSQTLTVHAPTPYLLFHGLDIFTSTACQATKTYTDLSTEIWTSQDGKWKYLTTTFPTYTQTAFEGSAEDAPINSAIPANLIFNHTIAKPFPNGDYSNFSFTDWAMSNSREEAEDFLDSYRFSLPDDFPEFLDSIPYIKSEYPDVGKCTNYVGDGEPTVHVPVNQLTDTAHVTLMMTGVLKPPSTPVEAEAGTTTKQVTMSAKTPALAQTENQLQVPTPDVRPPTTSPGIGDIIASVIGLVPIIKTTDLAQEAQLDTVIPPTPGATSPQLPEITIGTSPVTATPSPALILDSQTLPPEDPNIIHESTTYSLAPLETFIIIDGHTSAIPQPQNPATPDPQDFVSATTITPDAHLNFIFNSKTFSAGGPAITINGLILSVPPFASEVVIQQTLPTVIFMNAPIIVNGIQITPLVGGEYIFPERQTISPGGNVIVVSGTTYSLPSTGSAIVINGVTSAFIPTLTPDGRVVTRSGTTFSTRASEVLIIADGTTRTEDLGAFTRLLDSAEGPGTASRLGSAEATQSTASGSETDEAFAPSSNAGGQSNKPRCWTLLALLIGSLVLAR